MLMRVPSTRELEALRVFLWCLSFGGILASIPQLLTCPRLASSSFPSIIPNQTTPMMSPKVSRALAVGEALRSRHLPISIRRRCSGILNFNSISYIHSGKWSKRKMEISRAATPESIMDVDAQHRMS
jgi:hypothetical protein